jgi:hypothetical protein
MFEIKKTLFVALLAVGALQAVDAEEAQAQFVMTNIENGTTGSVVYQYRWGETGAWQNSVLGPGQVLNHYIQSNGFAPWLYIRFDAVGGDGRITPVTYRVAGYRGSDTSQAKRYQFQMVGWQRIDLRWMN